MEEQLISFETAKLAKENGFDLECHYAQFKNNIKPGYNESKHNWNLYLEWYSISTQALLQKWLREKHNLFVFVEIDEYQDEFRSIIIDYRKVFTNPKFTKNFTTYEKALEKGLKKALKLL